MSESLQLLETEPEDWAETFLRVAPSHEPPWNFQGPICPEILVDQNLVKSCDDLRLADCAAHFCHRAINDAILLPGEFPVEAVYAWYVQYYEGEVLEGGHGQWAANVGWDRTAVLSTLFGLERIGAKDCRKYLLQFIKRINDIIPKQPKRFKKILEHAGFNEQDAIEEAANDAFYELEHLPSSRLASWLRSESTIRMVPSDQIDREIAALAKANPLIAERRADLQRRRRELAIPWRVRTALSNICTRLGREMRACEMDALSSLLTKNNTIVWAVTTEIGVRHIVAEKGGGLSGYIAEMVDELSMRPETKRLIGKTSISKATYNALDQKGLPRYGETVRTLRSPFEAI